MSSERVEERKKRILEEIRRGRYNSQSEIVRGEGIPLNYVSRLLRLISFDLGCNSRPGGPRKKGIEESLERIRRYYS